MQQKLQDAERVEGWGRHGRPFGECFQILSHWTLTTTTRILTGKIFMKGPLDFFFVEVVSKLVDV